jgi:hypothetical protein
MENDRYWQKTTLLHFENVLECTFFRICIQSFQKMLQYYDPTNFFPLKTITMGLKSS